MYRILILGPQGSGKNTQAELLAKKLGIPMISAGDLWREEIAKKTLQNRMNPEKNTNTIFQLRKKQ